MKAKIIMLTLLFLINSCSKDEDTEIVEKETFNLLTNTSAVVPYQIVLISSDNLSFNQESYPAILGSHEVVLTKNNEGNLVFAIPNISSGNYELKLDTQNREGRLSFTVGSNIIQDVEATINEELLNPLSLINQNVDDFIIEGNLSAQTLEKLNSAKLMYSNFISQFASASNEDKLILGKFLNANPIFTISFEEALVRSNLNKNPRSNSDFACYLKNSLRISLVAGAFVSWVNVIGPAIITASGGIGSILVGAATLVGVYYAMAEIEASIEQLREVCLRPISNILYDQQGNSNNFTFNNNSYTAFNLKLGVRAVNASDIDDQNTIVSEVVKKINYIQQKWVYFKNSINQIVTNSTSWFNNWFTSSSTYEPVANVMAPLPQSSPISEILGNNDFITLEGIPNNITAQVENIGESGYNIKFNTDNANLPQSFQMNIKYNDGDFQFSDSFDVTLEDGENQLNLNGVWILTMLENGGTCTNNGTPIIVNTPVLYQITPNTINIWDIDFPWVQTLSNINYDEQTHEITIIVTSTYNISNGYECSNGHTTNKLGTTDTVSFNGQLVGDNIFNGITTRTIVYSNCSIDNHSCTYNSTFKAY